MALPTNHRPPYHAPPFIDPPLPSIGSPISPALYISRALNAVVIAINSAFHWPIDDDQAPSGYNIATTFYYHSPFLFLFAQHVPFEAQFTTDIGLYFGDLLEGMISFNQSR